MGDKIEKELIVDISGLSKRYGKAKDVKGSLLKLIKFVHFWLENWKFLVFYGIISRECN